MNNQNWNSCIDYKRNEIVFENRNKLFGAYAIRRDYSRHIMFSFFTAGVFLGCLLIPFFINVLKKQPNVITQKFSEVINLEIFTPPPMELKQQAITPPSTLKTIKQDLSNVIIVEDNKASADLKTESQNNAINLNPTGGEPFTTFTTGIAVPVIPDVIVDNTVKKWAEIMPEFQGGDEKLINYLSSHIRYPSKAITNNIEGTVYVSFIVDTSGLIKNVQLIQGIFEECNLEAMKAVRNMPKWIPGSQNGNKVSVEMSLPVRFVIK